MIEPYSDGWLCARGQDKRTPLRASQTGKVPIGTNATRPKWVAVLEGARSPLHRRRTARANSDQCAARHQSLALLQDCASKVAFLYRSVLHLVNGAVMSTYGFDDASRTYGAASKSERHDSKPWSRSEQIKMLALLNQTLKDLEARKATLERANQ